MSRHRFHIAIGLLFLTLAICAVAEADNTICDKCGKGIIEGDGICIVETCYHKSCLKCDHCGKRIGTSAEDRWITQSGKFYHPECFYRYVALRCYVCGEFITGEHLKDYWGNPFHESHIDSHPQCEYCSRFVTEEVTDGGIYYADSRIICHQCLELAISDLDTAKQLMHEVMDTMATMGIEINRENVNIRILSKDQMAKRAPGHMGDARGLSISEFGTDYSATPTWSHKIYILYGMPRYTSLAVIAHELMHVWLNENGKPENNEKSEVYRTSIEGTCNYMSYLTLRKYPNDEVKYQLDGIDQNRNLHYGSGFREVKAFASKHGTDSLLQCMLENGHL